MPSCAKLVNDPVVYAAQLKAPELQNTIIVRWWRNKNNWTGVDYILCSLAPVHSFSYSNPAHLEEIKRDVAWINGHQKMPLPVELYVEDVAGTSQVLSVGLDTHAFNGTDFHRALQASFGTLRKDTIFYNPSVSDKNWQAHFHTDFPSYTNDN